ncbi:5-beta-cholestane-3-alpha,7-alpha-diol 12-alpha-hydroxylase-like [Scleropages formosus]|uniref:5-beta-cholestane-3-alpha,7-alpha-diol 12-alpha-hydroxylase-like n=1 Tax=Scleropages formosus TaxID=113540 RepID=UPI0010FAA7AC|nr:5-beta-cholestane-3-alpha,7-alpha-diol 12-alpha-hydroxylase-like [Scleropages formosus]
MHILLPVLLAILACLLGGLYLLGAFRRRRPGEPPLDKGPMPWLGHVLEFRRDTSKFLQRMKKKHGDIFTVQLGGFYFTFIMDPLSFGAVVKESRGKLDFSKFAKQLVARVFGYMTTQNEHKHMQLSSNKHLMGDGLVVMTQAMMGNLQNLMLYSLGQGDNQKTWKEEALFNYCYNILFRAGYLTLFGNEVACSSKSPEKAEELDRVTSNELFYKFQKYDKLFPDLAYGVLPPREKMEAERLKRLFWDKFSVENVNKRENVSGWILEHQQFREENGVEKSMQDRFMFVLLWASQSNTGPTAFWLLLYLMKHPEAMRAVQKEVEEVLRATEQTVKPGGPLINLTRDMLLQTPVLDGVVEETLRLTTAPVLTRAVVEDMILKMADGREYKVRQGDRVSLFPYVAVHIDPDVHPDPLTFKYDRFLTPEGTRKTDFYKNGKKVKYYSMPWGAGVSMCPGRFFATGEVKQFVFLMLSYFEFELTDPEEKIPSINCRRWGFGSMHPTRNVQFRYRLRF